ncbi:MAG: hypothetical protein Q9227_004245 [Pyrenula ochraceoflavens]
MNLRLGLLRDTETIREQERKEAEAANAKKHAHPVQGPKTESQSKAEEIKKDDPATKKREDERRKKRAPKIRPLSEAKAIETGANFISESFLYLVGAGLIGFEYFRSKSKESTRREDVADRLEELEESEKAARRALVDLEREVIRLRNGTEPAKAHHRILQSKVWQLEEQEEREEEEKSRGWLTRLFNYIQIPARSEKDSVNAIEPGAPSTNNQLKKASEK